jgi:hypothetical protein
MYVFREFNDTHKGLVHRSMILHHIAVAAVWGAALFSLNDARAALTTTLVVLLAIHIAYIVNLTISYDLALTAKQYFATLCMLLAVGFMLLFAYLRSSTGVFGWDTIKPIFLWLALATFLAVYIDFAVASLLRSVLKTKIA